MDIATATIASDAAGRHLGLDRVVDRFADGPRARRPDACPRRLAGAHDGEDKADQVLAFTQTCRIVPLDSRTALLAADLCPRHKLATADAIIYATALEHGADLLTCDAHFDGLPGVVFIPKIDD